MAIEFYVKPRVGDRPWFRIDVKQQLIADALLYTGLLSSCSRERLATRTIVRSGH